MRLVGDDLRLGAMVGNLCNHALAADEVDMAETAALELSDLAQRSGNEGRLYPNALRLRGWVALRRGATSDAAGLFRESVIRLLALGAPLFTALTLVGLARALVPTQPRLAARLLGAAVTELDSIGAHPEPWEERELHACREELRAIMGEAAFVEEFQNGTTLTLDGAVQALPLRVFSAR
jgi:hypothetical protein